MHQPYVEALQETLKVHTDPANAGPMRAYMMDQFLFLGIKTPERRALLKTFIKTHGLPAAHELDATILALWALPEREYQYLALGLLDAMVKRLPPEKMTLLETLITSKSWWDTVDMIASHLVGAMLLRHPQLRDSWISRWRSSDNLWLRRTTLLFQLGYKAKTDQALLFDLIRDNLGSREFFINKAIGWALREYSKTEPEAVRHFVSTTPLHPLSQREALKWLTRQADRKP